MTCLVANMRVFDKVVNIFRMLTTMFSSAQFSVCDCYLMPVAFCNIIFLLRLIMIFLLSEASVSSGKL